MNRSLRMLACCAAAGAVAVAIRPQRPKAAFLVGAYLGYCLFHGIELLRVLDPPVLVVEGPPMGPRRPPEEAVRNAGQVVSPPAAPAPRAPEPPRPDRFELVELD